jgi:hypothetical protein
MVIRNTEESGAADGDSAIRMRLYLGEWSCAGRMRLTPAPQAQSVMPERSPGDMLPWQRPLSQDRNAVQFLTRPAVCR